MKKIILMAAVTIAIIAMAGGAYATDVSVSANVADKCGTFTPPNSIAQVMLDPTLTTAITGTATTGAGFRCTKGHALGTATLSGSTLTGPNSETITYTPSAVWLDKNNAVVTTGQGFGTNGDLKLRVVISIDQTTIADNTAGDYTGTLVLTITP